MEIIHYPENQTFQTIVDDYTAYVTYSIQKGELDIRHTIVPPEISGRFILLIIDFSPNLVPLSSLKKEWR